MWGSVAASFVIEQDGLPDMSNVEGRELWNAQEPMSRVADLQKRLDLQRQVSK
jgi:hypothetical protein